MKEKNDGSILLDCKTGSCAAERTRACFATEGRYKTKDTPVERELSPNSECVGDAFVLYRVPFAVQKTMRWVIKILDLDQEF